MNMRSNFLSPLAVHISNSEWYVANQQGLTEKFLCLSTTSMVVKFSFSTTCMVAKIVSAFYPQPVFCTTLFCLFMADHIILSSCIGRSTTSMASKSFAGTTNDASNPTTRNIFQQTSLWQNVHPQHASNRKVSIPITRNFFSEPVVGLFEIWCLANILILRTFFNGPVVGLLENLVSGEHSYPTKLFSMDLWLVFNGPVVGLLENVVSGKHSSFTKQFAMNQWLVFNGPVSGLLEKLSLTHIVIPRNCFQWTCECSPRLWQKPIKLLLEIECPPLPSSHILMLHVIDRYFICILHIFCAFEHPLWTAMFHRHWTPHPNISSGE